MTTTPAKIKERPIIFSSEMVRAILEGRKTMTRRVVTDQGRCLDLDDADDREQCRLWGEEQYGAPGDRLWVRETWTLIGPSRPSGYWSDPAWKVREAFYKADNDRPTWAGKWRSPIHMPRKFSRITLEITDVRVERVQSITAADCIAEGIPSRGIDRDGPCIAAALMYIEDFKNAWDTLNAKRGYSWASNPWVWVISFVPLRKGER